MTLKQEHFYVLLAIQMWFDTLIHLCDENNINSHAHNYSIFLCNANNGNNTDMELHIKQCINDFYDFFYVNQHICDVNYIHTSVNNFDNNYGMYENKLRLLDLLTKLENKGQLSIFQTITYYVFNLCCSCREELDLMIFEDAEKDNMIVKYGTKCL